MVSPADEQDNRQDKGTHESCLLAPNDKSQPDRCWPVTGKLGAIKNEGAIQSIDRVPVGIEWRPTAFVECIT